MGSNMAENHPVGFQWVMEARLRGAKVMHVDPRFTRTSAMCDLYVPIRAGTDIAFLGGLINYVIQNNRWFREYVLAYTNAATLITDEFVDADDLGGVFSGYHAEKRQYEPERKRWNYKGEPTDVLTTETPPEIKNESWSEKAGFIENPEPPYDPTLQDPKC